ncbi:YdcF family protein [Candidatus Contubernalis alkaliaceticus]|uniref:YdcF family protein n=1 Tax=Candidatus Contubernalis alkaliaceticus TaxID=338645 RepID=UPI001F4BFFC2|nr:YdcF family protein [Candidatus Contubernalis alkalaceticus]UNC93614.1 YdcF family protein [Candidatus Contubernalis alkalaceticus]
MRRSSNSVFKKAVITLAVIMVFFVLYNEVKIAAEIDFNYNVKDFLRPRLPLVGNLIVSDDPLEPADLIVVLMGIREVRIFEAADLYHEGYAPEILMVKDYSSDEADYNQEAAVNRGVPAGRIIILEGNAYSTEQEALYVTEYLKERKDVSSIILVTSRFHTARAKRIFSREFRVLDRNVKVISRPSRYDHFDPETWWRDEEDKKQVVLEYLKMVNYTLRTIF